MSSKHDSDVRDLAARVERLEGWVGRLEGWFVMALLTIIGVLGGAVIALALR